MLNTEIIEKICLLTFEKYINSIESNKQKDSGAYYTQEDITDYIAKNTILPFLLNLFQNYFEENRIFENILQKKYR